MDSLFDQAKAPLQLYNSLSRRVEPFRPTSADVLIRFLEDWGYRVRYVQNLTGIDDTIVREARRVRAEGLDLLCKAGASECAMVPTTGCRTACRPEQCGWHWRPRYSCSGRNMIILTPSQKSLRWRWPAIPQP